MLVKNKVIDEKDVEILELLQGDARMSLQKMATKLGLAKSTLNYRLKKLEEQGIIEGYYAKLNAMKLGKDYYTITFVRAKQGWRHRRKIGKTLHMNDDEKFISFLNRYFIFKKVLDVPIKDVKLVEVAEEAVVEVKKAPKQKADKAKTKTKKLKKKLVLED